MSETISHLQYGHFKWLPLLILVVVLSLFSFANPLRIWWIFILFSLKSSAAYSFSCPCTVWGGHIHNLCRDTRLSTVEFQTVVNNHHQICSGHWRILIASQLLNDVPSMVREKIIVIIAAETISVIFIVRYCVGKRILFREIIIRTRLPRWVILRHRTRLCDAWQSSSDSNPHRGRGIYYVFGTFLCPPTFWILSRDIISTEHKTSSSSSENRFVIINEPKFQCVWFF